MFEGALANAASLTSTCPEAGAGGGGGYGQVGGVHGRDRGAVAGVADRVPGAYWQTVSRFVGPDVPGVRCLARGAYCLGAARRDVPAVPSSWRAPLALVVLVGRSPALPGHRHATVATGAST
jgi:hypothetical protein